jgi:hypothetical protein
VTAIFNWRSAAHWCDARGPQACCGSLREDGKEARKKIEKLKKKFWLILGILYIISIKGQ